MLARRIVGTDEAATLLAAPGMVAPASDVAERFSPRRHGLSFWLLLWIAALAGEILALVPLVFDGDIPLDGPAVMSRLLGGSFAACGLLVWHRRPDSRAGQLMTATGFALFIAPLLTQLHLALADTIAFQLNELWTILFVSLILTFATGGRLRSRLDAALIAAFVLPLIVLQFVWLLFAELDGNLLSVFADADTAKALDSTQRALFAAAALTMAIVIAVRWRAASAPRRRALLPGLAGLVCLLFIVSLLITDLVAHREDWMVWIALGSTLLVPGAFLVGLLRSRLARGGLADLFRDLANVRRPELPAALAHAVGDPSLVVAYRLPGSLGYADAGGGAVMVPPAAHDRACTDVVVRGEPVAALVYDASLEDDPELVEAISSAAAIAIENEDLRVEAEERLGELQASRERIVAAGDAERRRLERNLHDGAQQRLVAIALQLRLLQDHILDDPGRAHELAVTARDEVGESLSELRELARGLHPAVLDYGLRGALEALAGRATVPTQVTIETDEPFPEPVELAAYFVACEALANIGKYAHASIAHVRVWRRGDLAGIEIADDGVGGADVAAGSGLRGLADRVEALDGQLRLSSPAGAGTVLTAELPCGS
jgi:signal transduction histidine kinase